MIIKKLEGIYSVLKYEKMPNIDGAKYLFTAVTDDEISVVCEGACAPAGATAREDGFCAYRVTGQLDFSLIGIIAKIADVLAAEKISVFVISTFDTDYFMVRQKDALRAENALKKEKIEIE